MLECWLSWSCAATQSCMRAAAPCPCAEDIAELWSSRTSGAHCLCLLGWVLGKGSVICVSFVENPTVTCFLYFDHFWGSALAIIHCTKTLLWWCLRAALVQVARQVVGLPQKHMSSPTMDSWPYLWYCACVYSCRVSLKSNQKVLITPVTVMQFTGFAVGKTVVDFTLSSGSLYNTFQCCNGCLAGRKLSG